MHHSVANIVSFLTAGIEVEIDTFATIEPALKTLWIIGFNALQGILESQTLFVVLFKEGEEVRVGCTVPHCHGNFFILFKFNIPLIIL
jgi:hypothetical protein